MAGLGSAILWWRAASATVKEGEGDLEAEVHIEIDGVDVLATAAKQAKLNRQAAILTGVAAIFGSIASALSLAS